MDKYNINLILAIDLNYAIGNNNDLLYFFPKDLKRFVNITKGKTVVMGRNTWKSLPKKLPNRKNLVISRFDKIESIKQGKIETPDNIINFDELLDLSKKEEVWVIGGAQLYKSLFEYSKIIELTIIKDNNRESDTFIKELENELLNFKKINYEEIEDLDKIRNEYHKLEFISYLRK